MVNAVEVDENKNEIKKRKSPLSLSSSNDKEEEIPSASSIENTEEQRFPKKTKRKNHNNNNNINHHHHHQNQKKHIPIPGVDPSPRDIEDAQKYQKWMTTHPAPLCFCGIPSRMKKVKQTKNKKDHHQQHHQHQDAVPSRAIGKYFFFCKTKKEDSPCRFAKLVDDVMKEQKRKDKKKATKTLEN